MSKGANGVVVAEVEALDAYKSDLCPLVLSPDLLSEKTLLRSTHLWELLPGAGISTPGGTMLGPTAASTCAWVQLHHGSL